VVVVASVVLRVVVPTGMMTIMFVTASVIVPSVRFQLLLLFTGGLEAVDQVVNIVVHQPVKAIVIDLIVFVSIVAIIMPVVSTVGQRDNSSAVP